MQDSRLLGFEHAPVGLITTRYRVVETCNSRFCEMFAYTKGELEGQDLSMLYPSLEEYSLIGSVGLKQMQFNGRYDDERVMKNKNHGLFWCRVRGQALEKHHPFAHAVWSFADLSDVRPVTPVTRREREVVMYMIEGKTSKEIADDLNISNRTVEAHRARLMKKFGARTSAELIAHLTGMPF